MRNKGLILLVCLLILSGCWDEKLLKDVTIVSLVGIEGTPGDVKAEFAFPVIENESISYLTSSGTGLSLRDARGDANHRTKEALDIASVEVILIAEESAKSDLYAYLDMLYRDPRNRLSGHIAIVQGELKPYFESTENMQEDVASYYVELVHTAAMYTYIPDIDIQTTGTTLFGEDMDLALPYIKIEEKSKKPEIAGVALFNGKKFTGKTLDMRESLILSLLKKKKGRYSRLVYYWKSGKDESPLAVEVINIKKKWKFTKDKINATYDLDLNVEEFPHDSLGEKKMIKELDEFLSKEMTKEFNEVVKKLQEAKSDSVGFGRPVRAFHRDLWNKGDWSETFSEIPIEVKVKAKITRTGILN